MSDDDLRNRLKTNNQANKDSDDLFVVWDKQRKMQAEDKKLERELAETKKKTRELKKTLYKNKFGEQKKSTKVVVNKLTKQTNKHLKKAYVYAKSHKKLSLASVSLTAVLIIGVFIINGRNNSSSEGTLGESDTNTTVDNLLPREQPSFKLLYPEGKSVDDYEVVRISPAEAAPSYTYLDNLAGEEQLFRVTQQEIPGDFDLFKTASDFQATSIIEIDGSKIYHGYSEKGGVQSLLFTKDNKLVLIRSTQKYSDDQWAAYYLSLK